MGKWKKTSPIIFNFVSDFRGFFLEKRERERAVIFKIHKILGSLNSNEIVINLLEEGN